MPDTGFQGVSFRNNLLPSQGKDEKMNKTPTIYKAFESLKSAENYVAKHETKYNNFGLVIEKISKLYYVMAY